MALGQSFQKSRVLQRVMSSADLLSRLIHEYASSRDTTLSSALMTAKSELQFCCRNTGLDICKHGLLLAQNVEVVKILKIVCETALEDTSVQIIEVTEEVESEHVKNCLLRSVSNF